MCPETQWDSWPCSERLSFRSLCTLPDLQGYGFFLLEMAWDMRIHDWAALLEEDEDVSPEAAVMGPRGVTVPKEAKLGLPQQSSG